jgi:putative pyrroloquinoline-quinone binding quinoprotein
MAKGKAIGRFEAALGLIGLAALGLAYAMVTGWNPMPAVQGWLERSRIIADPPPTWAATVDNEPSTAVVVRGVVVVAMDDEVAGYLENGGGKEWSRDVAWSAVAGSGLGAVVVAGKAQGHGYEALDPGTGNARWSDPTAIGAWTYTDLVIGIACPQDFGCVLTARTPDTGAVRWQAPVSGDGRPLSGANRPLIGIRPMGHPSAEPQPVPSLLGFPLDGEVQVVSTADGARLHRYKADSRTRVAVAGGRAVVTSGTFRDDACHLHADGRDPGTDHTVWHKDGYDLRTASGLGCDQRTTPSGGGGLIFAVSGDDRDVLLDPATGTEVYRAPPGETILDTDGHLVLVRGADKKTLTAVDVRTGGTEWTQPVNRSTTVYLGPAVIALDDADNQKITVVSSGGTVLLTVTTDGSVLGYASDGLIINGGRRVGLVSYGSNHA